MLSPPRWEKHFWKVCGWGGGVRFFSIFQREVLAGRGLGCTMEDKFSSKGLGENRAVRPPVPPLAKASRKATLPLAALLGCPPLGHPDPATRDPGQLGGPGRDRARRRA